MSYLALYRKYRPNQFSEVVGQEKIIKVIKNAVIHDKISHAYLFSGPRGTGKTTIAKLIASMVNCLNPKDGEPCGMCENCSKLSRGNEDVIEMDAASNNGVDEIRELRDKVNLVPVKCKFKVYIIDEVHMLTTGAFNALLKTLEEPPRHVIFILATTEPYKVPLTISSRCQKFQFNKLSIDEIIKRLKVIIEKESVSIEEDAIYELARLADGAMRDAIGLLDQLISYKSDNITLEDVHEINGTVSYIDMYNLVLAMTKADINYAIDFLERVDIVGKDIIKFSEELIIFVKDILITKNTNTTYNNDEKKEKMRELAKLYSDEILYDFITEMNTTVSNIKSASYPLILLQVTLFKIMNRHFKKGFATKDLNEIEVDDVEKSNSTVVLKEITDENKALPVKERKKRDKEDNTMFELKKIRINNAFATASKDKLKEIKGNWSNISEYMLDKKYGTIASMLNDIDVIVAGDNNLILLTKYDSVSSTLNARLEEIEDLLTVFLNRVYKVITICADEWEEYKKEFIDRTKKGIKYELISEKIAVKIKGTEKKNTELEQLIDSFGSDIIDYR